MKIGIYLKWSGFQKNAQVIWFFCGSITLREKPIVVSLYDTMNSFECFADEVKNHLCWIILHLDFENLLVGSMRSGDIFHLTLFTDFRLSRNLYNYECVDYSGNIDCLGAFLSHINFLNSFLMVVLVQCLLYSAKKNGYVSLNLYVDKVVSSRCQSISN